MGLVLLLVATVGAIDDAVEPVADVVLQPPERPMLDGASDALRAAAADGGARAAAADRGARGAARTQNPTAAPLPEPPTPTVTVEPTPTPTPTAATDGGFPPVPGCNATVPAQGAVANGQLSESHLCPIGDGHQLRPDAAAAFLAMDAAYRETFGSALCVTDSYRSFTEQQELRARKPMLAAMPGTSNHGWGLAVDLSCGADTYGGLAYQWLTQSGPTYGWENPIWARPGGSKPEPWHWEFDAS